MCGGSNNQPVVGRVADFMFKLAAGIMGALFGVAEVVAKNDKAWAELKSIGIHPDNVEFNDETKTAAMPVQIVRSLARELTARGYVVADEYGETFAEYEDRQGAGTPAYDIGINLDTSSGPLGTVTYDAKTGVARDALEIALTDLAVRHDHQDDGTVTVPLSTGAIRLNNTLVERGFKLYDTRLEGFWPEVMEDGVTDELIQVVQLFESLTGQRPVPAGA